MYVCMYVCVCEHNKKEANQEKTDYFKSSNLLLNFRHD